MSQCFVDSFTHVKDLTFGGEPSRSLSFHNKECTWKELFYKDILLRNVHMDQQHWTLPWEIRPHYQRAATKEQPCGAARHHSYESLEGYMLYIQLCHGGNITKLSIFIHVLQLLTAIFIFRIRQCSCLSITPLTHQLETGFIYRKYSIM